jgi:type III pantothenate kinase
LNLAIDIGNTRTKIGWFENNILREVLTFDNLKDINIGKLIREKNITKSIVSATKHIPVRLINTLAKHTQNIILDKTTQLPFKNKYATPDALGYDRIALAAAAHHQFPAQNNLVIGCGTCITYNFINADSHFIGGSIHPGLKMRLKAMHTFTQKLPLAEIKKPKTFFGKSTEENLIIGAALAAAVEMEAMIAIYKVNFSKLNVIISGGDAEFLVSLLKNKIFVQPNLTLIGLNHILEYNA